MKNLLNSAIALLSVATLSACSGTKTAADAISDNPITETQTQANPNVPTGPTGMAEGGIQTTVDTTASMFPVNDKGELPDASFVQLAMLSLTKNTQLSKMAQDRAQTSDLKGLAKSTLENTAAARAELEQLAKAKNWSTRMQTDTIAPTERPRLAANQLSQLSGDKFDRAYLVAVLEDHQRAVALFELGMKSKDADVKNYATKYQPKLRSQLAELEKMTR